MTAGIAPLPSPPRRRLVSAADEVMHRPGTTVMIDRSVNLCRWAVVHADGQGIESLSGPSAGQSINPSNSELAAQISAAVAQLDPSATEVHAASPAVEDLITRKTALDINPLAPAPEALRTAERLVAGIERQCIQGLVLACDASARRNSGQMGVGWVLSYPNGANPLLGSGTVDVGSGGILVGELSAIRKGLQRTVSAHPLLREGFGSLKIISDSRNALDVIQRVREGAPAVRDSKQAIAEAGRICGLSRGASISFEWVRGHSGDPLNEMADRLAVMARRNLECDTPDEAVHHMMLRARDDAREQLRAA